MKREAFLPRKHNKWKFNLGTDKVDNDLNDILEYGNLEDVIAKECFKHEAQGNANCKAKCHRQNEKSTNIEHLENDRYFDCDCTSSMRNPSQKSAVNENRSQENNNENRQNNVNDGNAKEQ